MSDLNSYIDTAKQFTAPPEGIPSPDRTEQVNLGVEIAQRAAQQQPPPVPTPMPPITPVAN